MNVTRRQIVARGLAGHCPNCGSPALFQSGHRFRINAACPDCGLKLDRGDGFFLGPFVINYTVTVALFIVPVILLTVCGVIGPLTGILVAGVVAFVVPILFYRRAWSWWLMTYFYFLPQKLPRNRDDLHEDEEE
ncbi:MAG TPA: DUF983 domain-containing protein [Opitutaceae bacterium]|nr:DUF983 domain-containing protein [Opitutaceae bacterium]